MQPCNKIQLPSRHEALKTYIRTLSAQPASAVPRVARGILDSGIQTLSSSPQVGRPDLFLRLTDLNRLITAAQSLQISGQSPGFVDYFASTGWRVIREQDSLVLEQELPNNTQNTIKFTLNPKDPPGIRIEAVKAGVSVMPLVYNFIGGRECFRCDYGAEHLLYEELGKTGGFLTHTLDGIKSALIRALSRAQR